MYRDRLEQTPTSSPEAKRLQAVMLRYHDHSNKDRTEQETQALAKLAEWQTQRLKVTHADLYDDKNYQTGIDFLLTELYSAKDFSARDRDLERIFPKLVKLLPRKLLNTVANLVELNLLTQKLDEALCTQLISKILTSELNEALYCEAYRQSDHFSLRQEQLKLVAEAGRLLSRHAKSSVLRFSLNVTRKPAENAGLEALHSFLLRGFDAFYSMQNVEILIDTLIQRESQILSRVYEGHPKPFIL